MDLTLAILSNFCQNYPRKSVCQFKKSVMPAFTCQVSLRNSGPDICFEPFEFLQLDSETDL